MPGVWLWASCLVLVGLGCHDLDPFPVPAADAVAADRTGQADLPLHDLPNSDLAAPDLTAGDLPLKVDTVSCVHPQVAPSCQGAWCTIPAGCFTMGSPASDPCRTGDEDRHQVTLTRAFEIGDAEVTQAAFNLMAGYNPAGFVSCGNCPVESVTWSEAARHCNALSAATGRSPCYSCNGLLSNVSCSPAAAYTGSKIHDCPGYRLCTDAELEYAHRAGTTDSTYNGPITACAGSPAAVGAIAWYDNNASAKTHPVKGKQANAWGLFDMAGNVWEWSHDWYTAKLGTADRLDPVGTSGTEKVIRGGSWYDSAAMMRSTNRGDHPPTSKSNRVGFRVCRSL